MLIASQPAHRAPMRCSWTTWPPPGHFAGPKLVASHIRQDQGHEPRAGWGRAEERWRWKLAGAALRHLVGVAPARRPCAARHQSARVVVSEAGECSVRFVCSEHFGLHWLAFACVLACVWLASLRSAEKWKKAKFARHRPLMLWSQMEENPDSSSSSRVKVSSVGKGEWGPCGGRKVA